MLGPDRETVRLARSPGEAKLLGTALKNRDDWDDVKIQVMHEILRAKFSSNSYLATLLCSTEDRPLVEGNSWGDTFWGRCDGVGENHLGRLLMKVRSELREGSLLINDKTSSARFLVERGLSEKASKAKVNHPFSDQTGKAITKAAGVKG